MQGKNTEIEVKQLAVFQNFAYTCRLGLRIFVQLGNLRVGSHKRHHADTGNGQNTGQQEQAAYADHVGNHRGNHQADRESQTDTQTYHRHRAGTYTVARQIRQQRGNCRTDRSRTLYGTCGNQ